MSEKHTGEIQFDRNRIALQALSGPDVKREFLLPEKSGKFVDKLVHGNFRGEPVLRITGGKQVGDALRELLGSENVPWARSGDTNTGVVLGQDSGPGFVLTAGNSKQYDIKLSDARKLAQLGLEFPGSDQLMGSTASHILSEDQRRAPAAAPAAGAKAEKVGHTF